MPSYEEPLVLHWFYYSMVMAAYGDNACYPEPFASLKDKLREGPGSKDAEILRGVCPEQRCFAAPSLRSGLRLTQHDSQDTTHIRSQEVLSPNIC